MSEDPQTRHQQPPHPPTTPHPFSSPPMLPPQMQQPQQQPNPLMTQTFLAWLQYVHLQNQLNQQHHPQHHPTQQPQQQQLQGPFPYSPPHQRDVARQVPHAGSSTAGLSGAQYSAPSPSDSTRRTSPAPVGGTPELTEAEQSAVTEDKRRRNTAASGMYHSVRTVGVILTMTSHSALPGKEEAMDPDFGAVYYRPIWPSGRA